MRAIVLLLAVCQGCDTCDATADGPPSRPVLPSEIEVVEPSPPPAADPPSGFLDATVAPLGLGPGALVMGYLHDRDAWYAVVEDVRARRRWGAPLTADPGEPLFEEAATGFYLGDSETGRWEREGDLAWPMGAGERAALRLLPPAESGFVRTGTLIRGVPGALPLGIALAVDRPEADADAPGRVVVSPFGTQSTDAQVHRPGQGGMSSPRHFDLAASREGLAAALVTEPPAVVASVFTPTGAPHRTTRHELGDFRADRSRVSPGPGGSALVVLSRYEGELQVVAIDGSGIVRTHTLRVEGRIDDALPVHCAGASYVAAIVQGGGHERALLYALSAGDAEGPFELYRVPVPQAVRRLEEWLRPKARCEEGRAALMVPTLAADGRAVDVVLARWAPDDG